MYELISAGDSQVVMVAPGRIGNAGRCGSARTARELRRRRRDARAPHRRARRRRRASAAGSSPPACASRGRTRTRTHSHSHSKLMSASRSSSPPLLLLLLLLPEVAQLLCRWWRCWCWWGSHSNQKVKLRSWLLQRLERTSEATWRGALSRAEARGRAGGRRQR